LIAVAITPDGAKLKLDALEIMQEAVIVSWTEKVLVVVVTAKLTVLADASITPASKALHLIVELPGATETVNRR
jgi:hypothetical protein